MRTTENPKTSTRTYRFTKARTSALRAFVQRLRERGIKITETEIVEQGIDLAVSRLSRKYKVAYEIQAVTS